MKLRALTPFRLSSRVSRYMKTSELVARGWETKNASLMHDGREKQSNIDTGTSLISREAYAPAMRH